MIPGTPGDAYAHTDRGRDALEGAGIPDDTRPPTNAAGVLLRIRTEQRRLTWLLDGCDRPRMPERVLTLLEDALLGLTEAGDQLERVMPAHFAACGCEALNYPHTSRQCARASALEQLAAHALPEDAPGAWIARAARAAAAAGGGS